MRIQEGPSRLDCHEPIIELDNVSFAYEQRPVIDDVCFAVQERDFVGLIGSNGAGKTTLMSMIVGLLKPTHGSIKLFGKPIGEFQAIGIGSATCRSSNQFNPLFPATVREVVLSGLYGRAQAVQAGDEGRCGQMRGSAARHENRGFGRQAHRRSCRAASNSGRSWRGRSSITRSCSSWTKPTVGIDAETQEGFFI